MIRAEASQVTDWRLPEVQKTTLTSCGVPLLDDIVEETVLEASSQDGTYHLARSRSFLHSPGQTYFAEPGAGRVHVLEPLTGRVSFVNSSIVHWLWSLHLVGTWVLNSAALQAWDQDEAMEDVAVAELADLLERIRLLDPEAYGKVGDHETHFWPGVLDRWLY
ncbi:hypothetical protein GCM10009557_09580 [Virgisporangium ochraceum]|uniref:SUKH-4 immunity protein of toxin-antitoxin system n=1 Tax=Virgisporangium ochraceum TaxID=65505 RepID=A0A8J4A011_9ACTN|nr:hypothetical protein Voc01_063100 [Virgisporangium ochraceum]